MSKNEKNEKNETYKETPILQFRKNTEIVDEKVEDSLNKMKILLEKVFIIYNRLKIQMVNQLI